MKPRITRAAALLLPLLLASCNSTPEQESADQGEGLADEGTDHGEDPPDEGMDLALCDGVEVDRMSDNDNCGECGNECGVWWPDTPYTAGGCYKGECGPSWSILFTLSKAENDTCAEVCAFGYPTECVARGCSGMTGYICIDGNCAIGDPWSNPPFEELTGDCDEPMVSPPVLANHEASYACCCERPEPAP